MFVLGKSDLTFTSSFLLRASIGPFRQLYWTGPKRTVSPTWPTPDPWETQCVLWTTDAMCLLTNSSPAAHSWLVHLSCLRPVSPSWEIDNSPESPPSVLTLVLWFPSQTLVARGCDTREIGWLQLFSNGEKGKLTAQQELIRDFFTKSSLHFDSFLYPWSSDPTFSVSCCFNQNLYKICYSLKGGHVQTEWLRNGTGGLTQLLIF